MDFRFVLVSIFLIFYVAFVRSTDNGPSKKKNSSRVQRSSNMLNILFLQPSNGNENRNLFLLNGFPSEFSSVVFPDNYRIIRLPNPLSLSNDFTSQISKVFPNNDNFPTINRNPSVSSNGFVSQTSDMVFPDSNYNFFHNNNRNPLHSLPRPAVQKPYTPRPYYHTSTPTLVSNTPIFNNNFTTSHISTPETPLISHTSATLNTSDPLNNNFTTSRTSTPKTSPILHKTMFNTSISLNNNFTTSDQEARSRLAPSAREAKRDHNSTLETSPILHKAMFNTSVSFNDNFTSDNSTPSISPLSSSDDLSSSNIRPVKRISEHKCDEYVDEIVQYLDNTSAIPDKFTLILVEEVGACESIYSLHTIGTTVVGGVPARRGEFPHMVALGRFNSNEFILMCGGTLISHTWVLSAAHCTHGPDGGPTHARIGIHNLTDQIGVVVAIKNITRHPDYKPPVLYADIALVQLMNDITFSEFIRPACLFQQHDTVPKDAWISGWGDTEFNGEVSDELQKVNLDLIENSLCSTKYNNSVEVPHGVTMNMLCAGAPTSNWKKDSCQGDSGGPLQILYPEKSCVHQVMGITSFGIGCAVSEIPGVYTKVSHYLPWIEEHVWPQGQ